MEQEYYSVKVTISPLGDGRYRSRIEPQAPDGSNFGAGNDFQLVPAATAQALPPQEFSRKLSQGAVSREMVEHFGCWLFNAVFQGKVENKYYELKGIAANRKLRLRICLALHSPELINIPWEVLHDESNFLIKHDYPLVRIMDELVGAKSSFAPIRNVLIAAANPKSEDYEPFEAERHVRDIETKLQGSTVHPEIFLFASRQGLLEKIRSGGFDALYFVGHGEASELGGRLICEQEGTAAPEPLEASDLAGALRRAENLRFVYLNSCSSAKTAKDNPFQGVAQRLMLDGDVAAVAAMQVDVSQLAAMEMAKTFFSELKDRNPEEAMHLARTGAKDDGYSFAVPVLYSYLDAPDQYEKNCLQTFLNAGPESKYSLVLPSFYLGQPAEMGQPTSSRLSQSFTLLFGKIRRRKFRYRGETFAREDAESATSVINLLSRVTPPDRILISVLRSDLPKDYSHYFLFGSKSNQYVSAVLKEFTEKFVFQFSDEEWLIRDREFGNREYKVQAPDKLGIVDYRERDDYGFIQKVQADDRVYFLLAGLGSRATQGCGWYLYRNWSAHVTTSDFAILLKFPGGLDFGQARVIDRETGEPKAND